jgi:hypothetical protein
MKSFTNSPSDDPNHRRVFKNIDFENAKLTNINELVGANAVSLIPFDMDSDGRMDILV